MNNSKFDCLYLTDLDAQELNKLEGGYIPGDIVTDSDGNMYRLDFIFEGGKQLWTKFPNNVC